MRYISNLTLTLLLPLIFAFDSNSVQYGDKVHFSDYTTVGRVLDMFWEECGPLNSYMQDIDSAIISKQVEEDGWCEYNYRCQEYGWKTQYYLQVKLKDEFTRIPRGSRMNGHTLHFFIGGGRAPGIHILKFPEICGVPPDPTGKYVHIFSKKFSFIDQQ